MRVRVIQMSANHDAQRETPAIIQFENPVSSVAR